MKDGQSYTTAMGNILEEMFNNGILDKVDIDSKGGRYKLLEQYIDRIRRVAEYINRYKIQRRKNPALYQRYHNALYRSRRKDTSCVDTLSYKSRDGAS